jgi:hypothetical protein
VTNAHARSADLTLLHPTFRVAVAAVVTQLNAETIPFQVFEAYRYPERQADLFAQGRTAPGAKVTNAPPWSSYHQYGLGADFVLFVDGKWSWDDSGARKAWWDRLQAIGRANGLEALSFEKPHLQLAGTSTAALVAGNYPPGGDDTWAENLDAAVMSWKSQPAAPKRPPVAQRPPLA